MVHAIASHLMGTVAALALLGHTLFLGIFLYVFILLRLLLRFPAGQRWVNPCITEIAALWMGGILWWMRRMQTTRWDIQGLGQLNARGWYLLTVNHQSWADIFVLFQAYHRKIPLLKFFIKKQRLEMSSNRDTVQLNPKLVKNTKAEKDDFGFH